MKLFTELRALSNVVCIVFLLYVIWEENKLNSLCISAVGLNSDIDFINMQVVLGFPVRKEGEPHNCMNDAQAAMKLVLAKLEHGYDDHIVMSCCDVRKN